MVNELRTVKAHIDYMRETLRNYSKDSYADLSDKAIYKLLLDARAVLISRRLYRNRTTSQFNKIPICVPLEKVKYMDCTCIPKGLDCYVLRSKFKLPNMFRSNYGEIMNVTSIDGAMQLGEVSPLKLKLEAGYTRLSNALGYQLFDGYLYVFGTLNLPLVVVNGLWVDPTDLSEIEECKTVSGDDCYDVYNSEFPIDPELNEPMYLMVEEKLLRRSQSPVDVTNDASAIPPNQKI